MAGAGCLVIHLLLGNSPEVLDGIELGIISWLNPIGPEGREVLKAPLLYLCRYEAAATRRNAALRYLDRESARVRKPSPAVPSG